MALLNVPLGIIANSGASLNFDCPYDTTPLLSMFVDLGLLPLVSGSCKTSSSDLFNDTYSVIVCPSGMYLKTAAEVKTSCANSTRACPSTFTPTPTVLSDTTQVSVAICVCKVRRSGQSFRRLALLFFCIWSSIFGFEDFPPPFFGRPFMLPSFAFFCSRAPPSPLPQLPSRCLRPPGPQRLPPTPRPLLPAASCRCAPPSTSATTSPWW